MGDKLRTIQNLEIIKSDVEKNLMFVKGSIPGSKNSLVLIQKNKKKIKKATTIDKIKKTAAQIVEPAGKSKIKAKTESKKETPAKKEVKK